MAFDFELAERMARLCGAVDVASPDVLDGSSWEGCPVRAFAGSGQGATSLAAVVDLGDRIAVAFRGTRLPSLRALRLALDDFLHNLDVRLTPFTATARTPAGHVAGPLPLAGLVHGGFHRELIAVLAAVEDTLLTLARRPLLLTGHSQGGAIAVLCARALEAAGWPLESVHTFGAPRAGVAEAVGGGTVPVHRVEHGHDIVPHAPPTALTGFGAALLAKATLRAADGALRLERWAKLYGSALPYVGAGTLWYARHGDVLRAYEGPAEAELLARRLRTLLRAGPALWRHHDLRAYLALLRRRGA